MEAEDLPYGRRTHTYNSRLAQELAAWADTVGGTDAMHDQLFRSYFADGLNIGDPEVLVRAAEASGADASEARDVLDERRFSDVVDQHWRSARQAGVTGVPTFVAGGYGVVGAQPIETLEALLDHAGARRT